MSVWEGIAVVQGVLLAYVFVSLLEHRDRILDLERQVHWLGRAELRRSSRRLDDL